MFLIAQDSAASFSDVSFSVVELCATTTREAPAYSVTLKAAMMVTALRLCGGDGGPRPNEVRVTMEGVMATCAKALKHPSAFKFAGLPNSKLELKP